MHGAYSPEVIRSTDVEHPLLDFLRNANAALRVGERAKNNRAYCPDTVQLSLPVELSQVESALTHRSYRPASPGTQ